MEVGHLAHVLCVPGSDSMSEDSCWYHKRHADIVISSPLFQRLLDEVRAEAWEEGVIAQSKHKGGSTIWDLNPYRHPEPEEQ